MRSGLLTEAVAVGLSLAVLGTLAKRSGMHVGTPTGLFILGAGTHLAWEAAGGNRWFVENNKASEMPRGLIG